MATVFDRDISDGMGDIWDDGPRSLICQIWDKHNSNRALAKATTVHGCSNFSAHFRLANMFFEKEKKKKN